ncbi:MAG: CHAP domain-containing protein, partial [Acetobacter sp.]|nr:CHAP domain-containing protein [Acetobacter sp.]
PAWEEWANADNRITYMSGSDEPQIGDIVIFDHVFCDSLHDHMGITVDVKEDTLLVAEGNFNNVSCVVERKRDAHIRCYIRIPMGFRY